MARQPLSPDRAVEVEPNGKHHQLRTVCGWHCRYDLQQGKFDVPPIFAKGNAKALTPE